MEIWGLAALALVLYFDKSRRIQLFTQNDIYIDSRFIVPDLFTGIGGTSFGVWF